MKFQIFIVSLTMLGLIDSQGCDFEGRTHEDRIGKGDCSKDGFCIGGCGNETKFFILIKALSEERPI